MLWRQWAERPAVPERPEPGGLAVSPVDTECDREGASPRDLGSNAQRCPETCRTAPGREAEAGPSFLHAGACVPEPQTPSSDEGLEELPPALPRSGAARPWTRLSAEQSTSCGSRPYLPDPKGSASGLQRGRDPLPVPGPPWELPLGLGPPPLPDAPSWPHIDVSTSLRPSPWQGWGAGAAPP